MQLGVGVGVLIICPQCNFSREVNESKISGNAVIATCPKCHCRFRVSTAGLTEILPKDEKIQASKLKKAEIEQTDEDPRLIASRAYEQEARRFEKEIPVAAPNAWTAAPDSTGWFSAFSQTILRVMFSAPSFFKSLNANAGLQRPLLFYLILSVIQIIIERIWGEVFYSMLSTGLEGGATADPQMEKLLSMLAPDTGFALSLLIRVAIMVIELYVFSFLMCLAYRLIVPEKVTFPLIFQILAYSAAPAILCLIPAIGSLAAFFWTIGCIAVGCKSALDLDWAKVFFGFLPIILLCVPIFARAFGLLS